MEHRIFQNLKAIVIHNLVFDSYYGPENALIDFLRERKSATVLYIQHPSPQVHMGLLSSKKLYCRGALRSATKTPLLRTRDPRLHIIYDSITTLFLVLSTKVRFHVFIGCEGSKVMIGLVLRKLGFVKDVVYLSHSYFQFSNATNSKLIRRLDEYCVRSVDFVWNLSRRLTKIREKQGLPREKNVWVPVGVHRTEIRLPASPPESDGVKRIVYAGALSQGKGIELIIKAFPSILRKVPKTELTIIGGGFLEKRLRKASRELGIERHVKFLGYVKYQKLMSLLPRCHIGLALYEPCLDNTAWTTDPLKPKLYMACGLPVIITDFPETASEVKEGGAGLVIRYDSGELTQAVIRLLTDVELFKRCSENAVRVAREYEWSKIFDNAFRKLFGDMKE